MNINRTLRFWWQRRTRGWDDSETWNLDATCGRWLAPRLRRFKELTNGVPVEYFKFENDEQRTTTEEADGRWHKDLDTMIAVFEWCADERNCNEEPPPIVQEGLELFVKRFHNLWW